MKTRSEGWGLGEVPSPLGSQRLHGAHGPDHLQDYGPGSPARGPFEGRGGQECPEQEIRQYPEPTLILDWSDLGRSQQWTHFPRLAQSCVERAWPRAWGSGSAVFSGFVIAHPSAAPALPKVFPKVLPLPSCLVRCEGTLLLLQPGRWSPTERQAWQPRTRAQGVHYWWYLPGLGD